MNVPSSKSYPCEVCGKAISVKAFYDRWHGPNCKAEEKKKLKIERQRTRRGDEYATIAYRDYVEALKSGREAERLKRLAVDDQQADVKLGRGRPSKLSAAQIQEIKARLASGEKGKRIASEYHVSYHTLLRATKDK